MDQETAEILAELNDIEHLFTTGQINKNLSLWFGTLVNSENMKNPVLSEKIISLLNLGIDDPRHKERPFEHKGVKFNIDVGLYNLIELLYDQGIQTAYSCQGDSRNGGYILFANVMSFRIFAGLCKAKHLMTVDVFADNELKTAANWDDPIPENGVVSVRFHNKDISQILDSCRS